MMKLRWVVVAALSGLGAMSSAQGAVVSFGAMKDNTLFGSTTGALSNGAGQYMFVGKTAQSASPTNLRRALIQFDVAGNVPAGSIITGVEMTLYFSTGQQTNIVSMHRLLASWGEGTSDATCTGGNEGCGANASNGDATWLHRFKSPAQLWTTPGGDFNPTPSASLLVGSQFTNDYHWLSTPALVADVQGWLNDPSSNNGWLLLGEENSQGASAKRFNTRENPDASTRPVLTITYTIPEPSTAGLLVLAAGWVMHRRPPISGRRRGRDGLSADGGSRR